MRMYAFFSNNGSYNTAVGYSALKANTTGNYNTALGYNTNVSANNLSDAMALGYNASTNLMIKLL